MLFFERSNGESELNGIYSFRKSNNLFLRSPGFMHVFRILRINENEMWFRSSIFVRANVLEGQQDIIQSSYYFSTKQFDTMNLKM